MNINMDEITFQLEVASFHEKIALAELEEAKAHERVMELKFEQTRYQIDMLRFAAKQMEAAQNAQKAQN